LFTLTLGHPSEAHVLDPRRAPRAPLRIAVEVRDRLESWWAEADDLGPKGCQLVSPRVVEPGRVLRFGIVLPQLDRTTPVTGRVAWARTTVPSRLGVAFLPDTAERGWFEALAEVDAAVRRSSRLTLERLSRRASLYLGLPPRHVVDFTPDEVAVLRRIERGITVDALVRTFGEPSQRALGAVFSLVARRSLVLDPAASHGPGPWRRILAEYARPVDPVAQLYAAATRSDTAHELYDEGLAQLEAGRIALAVQRFREALQLAPGDDVIASALRRLAPWTTR